LKFAVLDLVERSIVTVPSALAVMSAVKLWPVLLSDGMCLSEATGAEANVRASIMHLMAYVATIADADNLPLIKALLVRRFEDWMCWRGRC
jgi:hypothetical protein